MNITLNKLQPLFLEKEKLAHSQIWLQELTFLPEQKIQIVAPSGSGKTSLIHFLYGMRTDFEGALLLNGINTKNINAQALSNIRAIEMSIVFQDLRLFKTHTALENITVKKQLAEYNKSMPITEMAAALGIANKLEQPAGTCSFGEQQRIAIIRALQQPFSVIILDEPFSHLDEANSQKAMALITQEANKRKASIILADLKANPFFNADKILFL